MALKGSRNLGVPTGYILRQLFVALLPALLFVFAALLELSQRDAVAVADGPSGHDTHRRRRISRQQAPGGRPARSPRQTTGVKGARAPAVCRNRPEPRA
jgi:hypothetical protein